ncbi:MAG TPA: AMP-binding protein, partial [Terriglobia bacterium]|nr:AMP-binding protein [Terriglobia bacterium]
EIAAGRTPDSLAWKIADRVVFSKVREGFGGKVKIFISGGAPLGRELAEWFATVGIRICEGYGLTETSPVISLNTPKAYKLGTTGRPLPNVEVRIAGDGEILARGPSIFKGYWNLPAETEAAFEGEWFRTGDIGHLDADGFLVVTDRKKNLIKTSGGKFIAPQPLEAKLKDNPLIAEAVIVGDRHKFPAVVILPEFEQLEAWARENGVAVAAREALVADPKVRALYDGIISEANKALAQFEKMKRVLLIAQPFTIADGTLTPTLKLRRRAVEDRYKQEIEQLYREAEKEATTSIS